MWKKNGNIVASGSASRSSYTSSITDYVGRPVTDSPMTSDQYQGTYPNISGIVRPSSSLSVDEAVYDNYTLAALPGAMTGMSLLPAPSGWMLDLVAGTNPSRPVVNIPELVENIVDLPKALRGLGNIILNPKSRMNPKGFAGEYLGVQFGWLPLIEDLNKLLNFQTYVNKRNKELTQLYSGKGLRRRLKFSDDTTTTSHTNNASVSTSLISQQCSLTIKRETWATIHWYPTDPPSYHPRDTQLTNLSRRLVLGVTPEAMAYGLWKVIPWTWMIGWFTNLGKYTLAHSWTVPASHGTGCFMSKGTATYTAGGVTATNTKGNTLVSSGEATRTVRSRVIGTSATVGANMPYLDMFRLSILGALFVQKFKGRFGGLISHG